MNLPKDTDYECIDLCNAVNSIEGLETVGSCCGHGITPYRIWFVAKSLKPLPDLLYWLDSCHCSFSGWHCEVSTDCAKSPATFMIEGRKGKIAYKQSKEIAKLITKDNKSEAAEKGK